MMVSTVVAQMKSCRSAVIRNFVCGVLLIPFLCSCNSRSRLDTALECAGENRTELQKVLDYYQAGGDAEKLKAARFLIENMPLHYNLSGYSIREYARRIDSYGGPVPTDTINRWWDELKKKSTVDKEYDILSVKSDFLIHNIDRAFEAWKEAPWADEVDFELFCHYILPYRCSNEMLSKCWRDSLRKAYLPLVAGIRDMKEAYTVIHDSILHQMGRGGAKFPYSLDALRMSRQHRANCLQRCIFLTDVLRAVGIPAAIDKVTRWDNYSPNGHTWVALITPRGSFSITNGDKVARQNNKIDATVFRVGVSYDEDYPLKTYFEKRAAKVMRVGYACDWERLELERELQTSAYFSPFNNDVSAEYRLKDTVRFVSAHGQDYAYLCTFVSGKGWIPACYAKRKSNGYVFPNVGDSIAYLVTYYQDNRFVPADAPFIMSDGKMMPLKPDTIHTGTVVLTRKYPLIGSFVNNWAQLKGSCIEGSNNGGFLPKDILYVAERMPVFMNEIQLDAKKKYRYIRFVTPKGCGTLLTELQCWEGDSLLAGKPVGSNAEKMERCFDNDTFNMFRQKKSKQGYAIGLDFGKPRNVDKVTFYPKNDGNFVIPGDEYELFYYDGKWISLGIQKSAGYQLVYDRVPENALLWLRNHTKGKEERIFTYENGKQIWW